MRTPIFVSAILAALASPALAGGLDAPAASGVSWTGCYVGGHAGGTWGNSDKWIPRTPGGAFEGVSLGGHDSQIKTSRVKTLAS